MWHFHVDDRPDRASGCSSIRGNAFADGRLQKAQFEVIARNEYSKTYEKNPVDCSLYYIALRKKNVLIGLWRMAAWNREQSATQRLLSNNFQESRWKTTALKNAYALLGRHRFGNLDLWTFEMFAD